MKFRIGTRSSQLALWQAEHVADLLRTHYPQCEVELVKMSTKGDRILEKTLAEIGGKGLFTEELEQAMLEGKIDLAVHSLKDMPTDLPAGLTIAAYTKREVAEDAFVSHKYKSIDELPKGAKVGTSSLRRQAQLLRMRPDLRIETLRGNVNTRLSKLADFDAIILARAGLKRLGLEAHIASVFDVEHMIPAVGQGVLGIECVAGSAMEELLKPLQDQDAYYAVQAERSFLRTCNGGCQVPIGVHATRKEDDLRIHGLIASCDGSEVYEGVLYVPLEEAERGGRELAESLFADGAEQLMEELAQEGILK